MEHDLRHQACARRPQQEPHRLRDVLGPDHVGLIDRAARLGHRRVHEPGAPRGHLDALPVASFCVAWRSRSPRPSSPNRPRARPAPDAGGCASHVHDQRLAMLGSRLAQHRQRLARVATIRPTGSPPAGCPASSVISCMLADADAGAVHQHVEPAEPLAMRVTSAATSSSSPIAADARARPARPTSAPRPPPRACPGARPEIVTP